MYFFEKVCVDCSIVDFSDVGIEFVYILFGDEVWYVYLLGVGK